MWVSRTEKELLNTKPPPQLRTTVRSPRTGASRDRVCTIEPAAGLRSGRDKANARARRLTYITCVATFVWLGLACGADPSTALAADSQNHVSRWTSAPRPTSLPINSLLRCSVRTCTLGLTSASFTFFRAHRCHPLNKTSTHCVHGHCWLTTSFQRSFAVYTESSLFPPAKSCPQSASGFCRRGRPCKPSSPLVIESVHQKFSTTDVT